MKVRYDLAANVTPAMVLQEALANQHRYKAEPLFLAHWDWQSVIPPQRATLREPSARSMARIRETHAACEKEWREGVKIERTPPRNPRLAPFVP
ncbi:MAG: hypothetical protein WDN00_00545 [Limisphaerales bacterium]